MTTLTINNTKNFSLETLKKLLNSLDIEVVRIDDDNDDVPMDHWESIEKGLVDLNNGNIVSSTDVRNEAKKLCLR